LRPPVAEDRLSFAPDGSVLLRLKTPWRDGTSHLALEPLELLEKLAALIPRPYVNLIVYHGVLAPNAKWRREVVDFGRGKVEREPAASSPRRVEPLDSCVRSVLITPLPALRDASMVLGPRFFAGLLARRGKRPGTVSTEIAEERASGGLFAGAPPSRSSALAGATLGVG